MTKKTIQAKATAAKVNSLTCCAITQNLDLANWQWSDTEKQALTAGDLYRICAIILNRLESGGLQVDEMYVIPHGKDSITAWDDTQGCNVTTLKAFHVHIVIRFRKGTGGTVDEIAALIGLAPQYVEKPNKGRYAYDNMLSYLTHIKYADKFQYAAKDVITIRGRDYKAVYAERYETWIKGRAKINSEKAREDLDWLVEQIGNGQITQQQIMLTDEYFGIYLRNPHKCDEAMKAYGKRQSTKAAQALKNGEFKMSTFFLCGLSGSYKTSTANKFVDVLIARRFETTGEQWRVYRAATNNALDDYNGEEVILLDDVRGATMTATEWLLLLDPYNANPATARYKNKTSVASRVIIITSTIEPLEFFYYTKNRGAADEILDQFIRRLHCYAQCSVDNNGQRHIDYHSIEKQNVPLKMALPFTRKQIVNTAYYTQEDVYMNYWFTDGERLTEDEAIERMVSEVENSHKMTINVSAKGGDIHETND